MNWKILNSQDVISFQTPQHISFSFVELDKLFWKLMEDKKGPAWQLSQVYYKVTVPIKMQYRCHDRQTDQQNRMRSPGTPMALSRMVVMLESGEKDGPSRGWS